MNNYFPKNIKATLTSTEEVILENDENMIETVVLGGWVSNISNKDEPSLAGTTDYFTLKIFNTETEETINLYKDIPVRPNTTFPINKIHINHYNQLIISSTYESNLQVTLSYFEVVDYNSGVIKVNILPSNVLSLLPTWYFSELEEEYNIGEYVPAIKGLHDIEFNTILGWERPNSIQVNVKQLKTTEITATYTLLDSIVSFYTDQINLVDTFQWKLVGTDVWLNNLDTIILPVGNYEFEFLKIETYYKPDNITITTQEKTNFLNKITYEKEKETVTVILTPPHIKLGKTFILQNRWRVLYPNSSYSPWYYSGESVFFNINNNYIIDVETNDYFVPETNEISFNLELNVAMTFNINMV